MKVSVIIPVYNGEKYIKGLYDSLNSQLFDDFEIIFINDGSKDNSLKLIEEIALKDERVVFYSQENKGICASRNLGIEKAKGEYLIFLDQDDGIENNLIEQYYQEITTRNVDIVSFGKIHYYQKNGETISKTNQTFEEEYVSNKVKLYEYIFNLDNQKRLMTIWNCIYKKSIIEDNNIRFDEKFKHGDEDGMFNIEYGLCCRNAFFSPNSYYHYYKREGQSTITKYNDELLDNFIHFSDKVKRLTSDINDEYILTVIRLSLLRFFSNVYMRFAKYKCSRNEKIQFLKSTNKSIGFVFANELFIKNYMKTIPKKFFVWNIFASAYRKKNYYLNYLMLEIIRIMKSNV